MDDYSQLFPTPPPYRNPYPQPKGIIMPASIYEIQELRRRIEKIEKTFSSQKMDDKTPQSFQGEINLDRPPIHDRIDDLEEQIGSIRLVLERLDTKKPLKPKQEDLKRKQLKTKK